jgi:hypothetical protein
MTVATRLAFAVPLVALAATAAACRDVSRFSTHGDHYEGAVVQGDFVRTGIDPSARACLVLDADHLQDAPGAISSTDGRFSATPLRPIPQIWHDPLSTLSFGEGRAKNLVYVATPTTDGAAEADVTVVVSLMDDGNVEIRMLRGAPHADGSLGDALFGVFALSRGGGPCSY